MIGVQWFQSRGPCFALIGHRMDGRYLPRGLHWAMCLLTLQAAPQ